MYSTARTGPRFARARPLLRISAIWACSLSIPFNAILVGLTSNGFDVVLVLTDIPFSGVVLGLDAFPTSQTHCIVDPAAFDTDLDGFFDDEIIFNARDLLTWYLTGRQLR